MSLYRRGNKIKLYLLRAIFPLLVSLDIYLFLLGRNDYAIVLLFLIGIMGFLTVSNIEIRESTLKVRRFYFFGFFPIVYFFEDVSKTTLVGHSSDSAPDTSSISLDLAMLFLSELGQYDSERIQRNFIIQGYTRDGNQQKLRIRLTAHEYELISKIAGSGTGANVES